MKAISFQEEEGKEWVDQEKRVEKMDEHLKVHTFPLETEIGHEEEKGKAVPEKTSVLSAEIKKWRHSAVVRQQGKKEKEEGETEKVLMGKADSQPKELATDDMIMSDQSRPEEDEPVQAREGFPSTKNGSVSGLSSENSSIIAPKDGSATTTIPTSFGINYDSTSTHGSAENVSTAVIPIIKPCHHCNATYSAIKHERGINSAGHGTMYTAITPHNVSATSDTSGFGSVWDSKAHKTPLGSRLEILAGTRSDPPGIPDVKMSGKSRLELDKFDMPLWSGQVKSVNQSVETESDGIPGRAGNSVDSKGPHGDDDLLHSLQTKGLGSDQSTRPAGLGDPIFVDELFGEVDSQIEEGDALRLSQFTGAVKAKKEVQGFSGTITGLHSVSSGPVSSERMHQDSPSHSAVVTVTTGLQHSESSQASDREWAEAVPGWGLQSLGFVVEQPTEVKEDMRKEVTDDFIRMRLIDLFLEGLHKN